MLGPSMIGQIPFTAWLLHPQFSLFFMALYSKSEAFPTLMYLEQLSKVQR
jgi:hypothetical protein